MQLSPEKQIIWEASGKFFFLAGIAAFLPKSDFSFWIGILIQALFYTAVLYAPIYFLITK
jgi:hypothetical protein